MNRPATLIGALAAMLLSTALCAAESLTSGSKGSLLALSPIGSHAVEPSLALSSTFGTEAGPSLLTTSGGAYESIRYRPRRFRDRDRYESRDRGSATGFSQVHAGFFDPTGDPATEVLFGFRAGSTIDQHVQIGLGLDWSHKSDTQSEVLSREPIPGGGTAEVRRELSRSSSHLFPIMALIQFVPGTDAPVIPYFGAGGGYEVLFLSSEDLVRGEKFDGTFSGWGWQVWGGAALPLASNSRLSAEVFLNQAEVTREVDVPDGTVHEVIDLDGAGMRFGLTWGF